MSKNERPQPPRENLTRIGALDYENYLQVGDGIRQQLHSAFIKFNVVPKRSDKILDFGCGIGRVTFPMSESYDAQFYACDVDHTAIEYVKNNTKKIKAIVSNYHPPLPFEDNFFDLVYSNSVWTHFPKDAESIWLEEMARVTRSGAKLFLSIASYGTLAAHHRRGISLDYTQERLDEEGFLFIENKSHDKHNPTKWPGVTHEYGLARHSHGYVRDVWSKYFKVIDIIVAGSVKQDVVVLENNNQF